MKRLMLKYTSLIMVATLAAIISLSCGTEDEPPTPIFPETEVIDVSYSGGTFYFSPGDDVEYVVIGIFGTNPIRVSGKTIVNMNEMQGGNRTPYMNRTQVAEGSLEVYSDVSKSFTGAAYNPSGNHYWAVWGFNADFVIIASSAQQYTNFP